VKDCGLLALCSSVSIVVLSCATATDRISSTSQESNRVLIVYGEEIRYLGGLGHSCSDPVIIIGASDDATCVEAQYAWIRAEFRDFQPAFQQLVLADDGRKLSEISIETPTGNYQICFDVSECETLF